MVKTKKTSAIEKTYHYDQHAYSIVEVKAQKLAKEFGSTFVEPIHILIAFTEVPYTFAETIIISQRSSLAKIRASALELVERDKPIVTPDRLPWSTATERLLSEAERFSNTYISPEHLIVGTFHLDEDDPAYRALHGQNIHCSKTMRLAGIFE